MEELASAGWVRLVIAAAGVVWCGLPVMTVVCFWQALANRSDPKAPLEPAWREAGQSFLGMTLASVVLIVGAVMAVRYGLDFILREFQHS